MIPQEEVAKAFNLIRSTGLLTDQEAEELSYKLKLTYPIRIHKIPMVGGPGSILMAFFPDKYLQCQNCSTIFSKDETHACTLGGKAIKPDLNQYLKHETSGDNQ
jgi:hypothetical protein